MHTVQATDKRFRQLENALAAANAETTKVLNAAAEKLHEERERRVRDVRRCETVIMGTISWGRACELIRAEFPDCFERRDVPLEEET